VVRFMGGLIYLAGMLLMAWNVTMTVTRRQPAAPLAPVLPAHA